MALAYLTNPPDEIAPGADVELSDGTSAAWATVVGADEAWRNARGVGTIVEPGAPVPYGQRETGLTLALVEGQAVRQRVTEDVPLAELKAAKWEEVNAAREAVFDAGYEIPVGMPGAGHHLQVRNADDKAHWLEVARRAKNAVDAGHGAAPGAVTLRTQENVNVACTPAESLTVLDGLSVWVEAVMQASWTLKDVDIAGASSAADLAAIDIEAGLTAV